MNDTRIPDDKRVFVNAQYAGQVVDPVKNEMFQRLVERRHGILHWCICRTEGTTDPHELTIPDGVHLEASFDAHPGEEILTELREAGFSEISLYEYLD